MLYDINLPSATSETICAISTPSGVGGIAVARLSGPKAIEIASRIWRGATISDFKSHSAHLGTVLDSQGLDLDQAVCTLFRGPKSFTGEDVIEFSTHGSKYVQQEIIQSLIAAGARLAQPGEFTRRAFLSGKFDLAQAEAVADVISAQSRAAHRIAANQMRGAFSSRLHVLRDQLIELSSLLELELDFSEEDVEFASRQRLQQLALDVKAEVDRLAASFHAGQAIKDGIPVAIVGATNAGKSSLLNALLGDDRAIVSSIHGTTRDIVEDRLPIGDYLFRLMDTAGLRHSSDEIERMGIERSIDAAAKADIILCVIDASNPVSIDLPDTEAQIIAVANKSDLPQHPRLKDYLPSAHAVVPVSAKRAIGIDDLKAAMADIAQQLEHSHDAVMVTNLRHQQALLQASESISRVIDALAQNLSGDLVAQDLRLTIHHLSSILGDIPSSEILASIFSRFCIGK